MSANSVLFRTPSFRIDVVQAHPDSTFHDIEFLGDFAVACTIGDLGGDVAAIARFW